MSNHRQKEWMNEKPFEYRSENGCRFKAARCDWYGGIDVEVPKELTDVQMAADFAEVAGYHAVNIREELNGFSGYAYRSWNVRRV
ncbi:MAG: hypothetical protein WAZ27_00945 [Minisyncoccia bacterium]